MSAALPRPIQSYVDASNAHDVKSILESFADDAVVRDENATRRGKIDIERWASETIEKYKFHFKPLNAERRAKETVVSVEVSGSFPGSPVTLDYHFTVAKEKISSLIIDS
jgi:ketosteroid isomerase-like protein